MQQPRALSPASLAFRDGTPYSAAYGDVYHSAAGGPAQARHVFLGGNSLPRPSSADDDTSCRSTGQHRNEQHDGWTGGPGTN